MIGLQQVRRRQLRLLRWWDSLWWRRMPRRRVERERERSIRLGWMLGLLSIIPDIIVMILTGSVTVRTDVFRTGTDTLASFLSWLTVRKIARGHATAEYNYGYGKLENLSGLAIAATMMLSFMIIVFSAVERLHSPLHVTHVTLGIVFTSIAGLTNAYFWVKNQRLAKREPSPVMESQWRLFRAKTSINLCVLISLSLSALLEDHFRWALFIDPIASLLLASFLAFSAYQIVSVSVYDLLDRSLEESLKMVIDNGLEPFADRFVMLHGLRSRKSGRHTYIELFLEFNAEARMSAVLELISQMQRKLEAKIPGSHIMIVPSDKPVE